MRKFRIILGYTTLILIAISMLYPFFAMLNLSFVNDNEIFSNAGKLIHTNLTLNNYKNVFNEIALSVYFLNQPDCCNNYNNWSGNIWHPLQVMPLQG